MNTPKNPHKLSVNERLDASGYPVFSRYGTFFLGASSILSELFFETRLDPPPTYTLGTKEANERHREGNKEA